MSRHRRGIFKRKYHSLHSKEYHLSFLFVVKRVWVSPKKAAFVLTNAMLVLSNKHIKNLDEFHRGFYHPYDK